MKTTLAWLKTHLETSAALDDIAGRLAMLGLEVESIENRAKNLAPFTVARVVSAIDGGRILNPKTARSQIIGGIAMGIGMALLEETVMRGAMHTAIERESGPWSAALLTAPLFAVLHFFAKARIPPEDVGWGSGFDLLLRSFSPLAQPALVFDSFLSWLIVGLILSLTRVLTGNIAVAIGLHAGWVVVLRMLQEGTGSGAAPQYAFWVGRFDGLLGYWLLPWGICIAIALWLTRAQWVPQARCTSAL